MVVIVLVHHMPVFDDVNIHDDVHVYGCVHEQMTVDFFMRKQRPT